MSTSRDLIKTFFRYAKIRFELDGTDLELSAFKSELSGEDSEDLFIPFRDATSGRESYGAGRFLSIDEPDNDRFVLDFNRCYNPLCNYSPAYNCAVPPAENHLAVPIRAGEKTYTPSGGRMVASGPPPSSFSRKRPRASSTDAGPGLSTASTAATSPPATRRRSSPAPTSTGWRRTKPTAPA